MQFPMQGPAPGTGQVPTQQGWSTVGAGRMQSMRMKISALGIKKKETTYEHANKYEALNEDEGWNTQLTVRKKSECLTQSQARKARRKADGGLRECEDPRRHGDKCFGCRGDGHTISECLHVKCHCCAGRGHTGKTCEKKVGLVTKEAQGDKGRGCTQSVTVPVGEGSGRDLENCGGAHASTEVNPGGPSAKEHRQGTRLAKEPMGKAVVGGSTVDPATENPKDQGGTDSVPSIPLQHGEAQRKRAAGRRRWMLAGCHLGDKCNNCVHGSYDNAGEEKQDAVSDGDGGGASRDAPVETASVQVTMAKKEHILHMNLRCMIPSATLRSTSSLLMRMS